MGSMRIVTFDVDWTLVSRDILPDGIEFYNRIYVYAMTNVYGLTVTLNDLKGTDTSMRVIIETMKGKGLEERVIMEGLHDCFRMMEEHYRSNLPHGYVHEIPGAGVLVEALSKKGIQLGLVTGNIKAVALEKLKLAGIEPDLFSFGAWGDQRYSREELMCLALERASRKYGFELDRPASKAFHFGDSPFDVIAARKAGFVSIGVISPQGGYKEELIAARPEFVVDGFIGNIDSILSIVSEEAK